MTKDACWMLPPKRIVFIQLGRAGDLIILFPAFKAIHDRTGIKPVVLVSQEYANLFDGISYAVPWSLAVHWYGGVPEARRLAKEAYGEDPILPQWWQDGRDAKNVPRGNAVLQCHGANWGVDVARWPNFQTSMWDRAGFTVKEMMELPLVFDRRNPVLETALVEQTHQLKRRPLLLTNFTGISSPFAHTPDVIRLLQPYRRVFDVVDLGQLRFPHLYDLLGLYDRAVGLITTDTATLHLAPASKVPYVAFTVDGWCSSVPRGNCVLEVKYSQTKQRIGDVLEILQGWAGQYQHAQTPVFQKANA